MITLQENDATDRGPAQQPVEPAERRFRSLIEHSHDLITVIELDGTLRYLSPSVRHLLGYEPDDSIGRSAFELIHPDDAPAVAEQLDRLRMDATTPARVEFRIRHRDGGWRVHEVIGSVMDTDSGAQVVVNCRDVTDERAAGIELRRSRRVHRRTGEALLRRDAVLEAVSTAAGRFLRSTDWRSSMEHVMRMLGEATQMDRVYVFENTRGADGVLRTEQQMEWVADGVEPRIDNRELSDLSFAAPDLSAWKQTLEQGGILCQAVDELGGELGRQLESRGIRSVVVVPIFAGAAWWGFIGFDECRRPRQWPAVELDALRMAADILGAAIHRQPTETALWRSEEQLRQAQKMEAVGRLAGGIAHDFNNMLTAISGFASLLRSEMDEADPRVGYVDEIEKAAVRSADLTRQLLAYSRQQIHQPRALDLNSVVARISGMLRRVISEDIRLESVLAPGLATVDADAGQVEQMIMNLVINARDAITGGGLVQILTRNSELCEAEASRLGCMARPGTYVVLSVRDTGCGMDAETRLRLFEPFYTTKAVGEGTGFGLATVHGIVEQNGGFIRLRTAPGRGTTFDVYLPRSTPQAASGAAG